MYAVERRRWLVDHARSTGRIDVAEVAGSLAVARETIRRDLNALEGEGLLRRVHGGAVPVERVGFEGRLALRSTARSDVKARIADLALTLIDGVEFCYVDEGSTAQAFAERLHPGRPLTVVTNALQVATLLAPRDNVDVVLVGGRVRPNTFGAIDHWATRMIDEFVFDLAVMGCNGITLERGLSCADGGVAAVKAHAVAAGRRVMLLADGSKFGTDSTYRFAQVRDLDIVVTDRTAGDGTLRRLRASGADVVLA